MPRNDVRFEVFYDNAWHDLVVADYVLANQAIEIKRGDGAESAAPRPASLAASLNNDTDLFRVTNPTSPLYGKIGRNVPVRVKVNDVTRVHVLASSWKTSESRSFRAADDRRGRPKTGSASVDIEGGGLLQQIGQWKDTLDSAIVRDMARYSANLVGFWPLEDPSGATSFSSGIPGGRIGRVTGSVSFGESNAPGGAASAVTMGSDGQLDGAFNPSSANGYQVSFAMRVTASLSGTLLQMFNWYDNQGRRYTWEMSAASYAFHIRNADTDADISYVSIGHSIDVTQWVRCRAKISTSGSDVVVELSWYQEGASGTNNTFFTYPGSAGALRRWNIIPSAWTDGASYAAVAGINSPTPEFGAGAVLNAFNGHAGESPADRFTRLMTEKGLAYSVSGADGLTTMGPQKPDTLAALLREVRDTEDGLLFDTRGAASVTFMTRAARFNQTAVSIHVSELPTRPSEVTDDLGVYNIVTARNRSGAEAIAEDSTSSVGSADSPTGIGPYEQTIDINIDDDTELDRYAAWWLKRGTVSLPRYPAVTVNLAALTPARAAEIAAIDVGNVIEIKGYREDPIRLTVIGYSETIGWPNERTITFTTVPDQLFQVGVYGTGRYDSATTTLAAEGAPGATSLSITSTWLSDTWSTTAVPYDWRIAGETVTVTAVTSPAGSLGTYTQTATVRRSLNGVSKRLAAGEVVRLATPARYGL